MSLFDNLFYLVESVWQADRKIRDESIVGESEFENRSGRIVKIVLTFLLIVSGALAIWWLAR